VIQLGTGLSPPISQIVLTKFIKIS